MQRALKSDGSGITSLHNQTGDLLNIHDMKVFDKSRQTGKFLTLLITFTKI